MVVVLVVSGLAGWAILATADAVLGPVPMYRSGPWTFCPKCNYSLDGFDRLANCPECGLAAAASAHVIDHWPTTRAMCRAIGARLAVALIPTIGLWYLFLPDVLPDLWAWMNTNAHWVDRPLRYWVLRTPIEHGLFGAHVALALIGLVVLPHRPRRDLLVIIVLIAAANFGGLFGIAVTHSSRSLSIESPGAAPFVGALVMGLAVLIAARCRVPRHGHAADEPSPPVS